MCISNSLFPNSARANGHPQAKNTNFKLILIFYTLINSKWIISLRVKYTAIKNFRKSIQNLELSEEVLDLTIEVQLINGKNDKSVLIKIKNSALPKTLLRAGKSNYSLQENNC